MSLSVSTTPRTSIDLAKEAAITTTSSCSSSFTTASPPKSKASTIWDSIKRHAKKHHEDVNAAYVAYYGLGEHRREGYGGKSQEIWEYKRGGKN
ncbi:hypothetical protein BDU57DRAFT_513754 [Ampelomyces quisqualis]|uniref:Uncharacterized protein n=1 Tax=Ampelomyces quisqualis TaxID=50730 RepID=A0A6A5QRM0_AMPQU|nr:hypothetical protein BDU57DRAFT_513754 [Ampelomyces quisqualis]